MEKVGQTIEEPQSVNIPQSMSKYKVAQQTADKA
jgi:hypothetical protein